MKKFIVGGMLVVGLMMCSTLVVPTPAFAIVIGPAESQQLMGDVNSRITPNRQELQQAVEAVKKEQARAAKEQSANDQAMRARLQRERAERTRLEMERRN
jgi:hypothetical protein